MKEIGRAEHPHHHKDDDKSCVNEQPIENTLSYFKRIKIVFV